MPDVPHSNHPDQWSRLAEEARALAERMRDQLCKEVMFRVADDYDKLRCASLIARRLAQRWPAIMVGPIATGEVEEPGQRSNPLGQW